MKYLNVLLSFSLINLTISSQNNLELIGVLDLDVPTGGSTGKAIHVKANQNISDLSIFGIGIANNGGGTDGQEYTFPSISLNTGEDVIVCRDTVAINSYFIGCSPFNLVILDDQAVITQNGDDAIELFENGVVIETFGDINVDGTGELWEYKDSWAYKDASGSVTFNGLNWAMGGVDCTDGSTTSISSNCPYPTCVSQPGNVSEITFKVDMSQLSDPFNIPELNGTFNNWCGDCNPLSDANGDEIWEVTLSLNVGDTIEYKFSADNWTFQETLDPNGSCTNGDPNFTNRVLIVPVNDTILPDVCWGSCDTCSPIGAIDNLELNDLSIFPNPTSSFLTIQSNNLISPISIYDITGKLVLQNTGNSKEIILDISNLNSGLYFIKSNSQNSSIRKRFIVSN